MDCTLKILVKIDFKAASTSLGEAQKDQLGKVVPTFRKLIGEGRKIVVEGGAEPREGGSERRAGELARARGGVVAAFLVRAGLPRAQIVTSVRDRAAEPGRSVTFKADPEGIPPMHDWGSDEGTRGDAGADGG